MKICLAASGGGHIRQLLDLQPLWQDKDYFFVTEDTALGRSIAEKHSCDFVSHVALGQAKLGSPFKMLWAALLNFFQSFWIIIRRRPVIVITTGAGSMFFTVVWARLLGARVVVIDSFARFESPSTFAKMAGPFANLKIAQSGVSGAKWGGAQIFDPFRILKTENKHKDKLLFATVGATLPFERLVNLVAGAKKAGEILEDVVIQIGENAEPPEGVTSFETLPFDEMMAYLERADIVVCHGGTGSLITALRAGCRVIAVPRRFEFGEHYDDHQSEITRAFRDRGLLQIADTPDEFAMALKTVRARDPISATTDPSALIDYLRKWIGSA